MKKGKKKPGTFWIVLAMICGYYTLSNFDGIRRIYNVLLQRGPEAVLQYLDSFPYLILYFVLPVLCRYSSYYVYYRPLLILLIISKKYYL